MLSLLKADMNRQPIPYASCPLIGSRLRLGAHHGVRTHKALYACYDLVSASFRLAFTEGGSTKPLSSELYSAKVFLVISAVIFRLPRYSHHQRSS